MSVFFPPKINELSKIYNRYSRVKSSLERQSVVSDKGQGESRVDTVDISSEARRKLVRSQIKGEVLDRIRKGG